MVSQVPGDTQNVILKAVRTAESFDMIKSRQHELLGNFCTLTFQMQAELDNVVGRSRLPSLKDRPNLPYTEAVLMEAQRIATIAPFSVPRAANIDTKLFGYDIPKGTMILPNLWRILHDESIWKEPHKFDPSRFLDELEGLNRREELIPFSLGKNCLKLDSYSTHLAVCTAFPHAYFCCLGHERWTDRPITNRFSMSGAAQRLDKRSS